MFRSLLEKAPEQGASEEFTRQLNDATIQMQQAIIDAQDVALASQEAEAKLRSRLQELERQTARSERWPQEISRYKLVDLGGYRGMVYALRDEYVSEDEHMHYLCTKCAEEGFRSILQYTGTGSLPYDCRRCWILAQG